jgi:hypothetical protein
VQDGSGATLLQGVLAQVLPVADDMPLGTDSVEADGVDYRPDDDVGRLCHDFVLHGASPGTLRYIASGDVAPAPRSSGATSLVVAGLLLSGSLDSLPLPVN